MINEPDTHKTEVTLENSPRNSIINLYKIAPIIPALLPVRKVINWNNGIPERNFTDSHTLHL